MSPIEEEVQEGHVHQERDLVVDALFPSESEDDYSGSQQSIKLKVVGHISTLLLCFKSSVDLFYICYEFQDTKSCSNPEEATLTSQ